MPFRSSSQRRWMFANHPSMAKQWAAETPKGEKLPEHVEGSKSSKRKKMRKKAEELGPKLAAALQPQQLIPGAPPVMRLPVPGQQPQGAAPGQPQQGQPPAPAPQAAPQLGKGTQQALTSTNLQKNQQAAPGAVVPSEAAVAAKLNKMACDFIKRIRKSR